MVTFYCLMKLIDKGIKNIKDAIMSVKAIGGKVTGFFLTMGDYDYVSIVEIPIDELCITYLLRMGSHW